MYVYRQDADGGTWALNRQDVSPYHLMYPNGYNSRCNCCYLNQSHTEAVHAAELERYSEPRIA